MGKDVEFLRQPGCWLRSSHTFKECVIAHWSSDSAPKKYIVTGNVERRSVGERSQGGEGLAKAGLERCEVSMPELVTIKRMKNPFAACLRFPGQC